MNPESASRTAGARDEPSAVGVAFAALVASLSPGAAEDLAALISHKLDFPSAAELREARLGLLLDMVSVSEGEIPSVEDYEGERAARVSAGEQWPAASTLSRAYRGWPRAVRAAVRLHALGPAARVPSNVRHARFTGSYTRDEIVAAFTRFREAHGGQWPRYTEFFRWGAALRRRARHRGHPDPRVSGPKQVRDVFGGFAAALRAAKRADVDD